MSKIKLFCADCLDILPTLDVNSVDTVISDVPSGTSFMGRKWDNKTGYVARTPKGMQFLECGELLGLEPWAAGFVSFMIDVLTETYRVMKPGAMCLIWALPRTADLTGLAMRVAGLEVRDTITHLFGCLSEDTEILTADGWKTYGTLFDGDSVMCYNLDKDNLEWGNIQEVYAYAYDDTAYHIRSNSTDQIVSRNHRCIVERGGKYVFKKAEILEYCEGVPILESLPELWHGISLRDESASDQEQVVFSEMRGAADKQGQNRQANQAADYPHLSMVRQGIRAQERSRHQVLRPEMLRTMEIEQPRDNGTLNQDCISGACRLDRREHGELSREHERGEQSSLEGRRDILSEEGPIWAIQHQVREVPGGSPVNGTQRRVHNGTPPTCGSASGPMPETFGGRTPQGPQPGEQRLGQPDALCQQLAAQAIRGKGATRSTLATVTPIHYKGIVWCVRVPTGAFVARRNGHVFVTGNSGFPKSLDVGKAIDKVNGETGRLHKFTSWMRTTGLTARHLDEVTGTNMGGHYLTAKSQPSIPTSELWKKIRPLCNDVPDWVDELVERIEAEREIVARVLSAGGRSGNTASVGQHLIDAGREIDITAPATDAAKLWNGYGTSLKPSVEHWLLGMKPLDGTFASNALTWNVAGLWIDGSRIGPPADTRRPKGTKNPFPFDDDGWQPHLETGGQAGAGRFPANLILSHHPECRRIGTRKVKSGGGTGVTTQSIGGRSTYQGGDNRGFFNYASPDGTETISAYECHPECPIRLLGEQSGERPNGYRKNPSMPSQKRVSMGQFPDGNIRGERGHSDTGTAARFFLNLEGEARFVYQAKASKRERNDGLDDFYWRKDKTVPFGFVRVTLDEWNALPEKERAQGNVHATVKSRALMAYLCKLTRTPTGGTVLDFCMGSGSTGLGCIDTDRDFIGIERDIESFEISQARIEHVQNKIEQLSF